MQPPAEPQQMAAVIAILGWLALVSALMWGWWGTRLASGHPVIGFQRRRRLPWGGLEVFLLLAAYLVLPIFVTQSVLHAMDLQLTAQPADAGAETDNAVDNDQDQQRTDTSHVVFRLLREANRPWAVVVAILTAVVAAPIVEEFAFRLLFQGWLEAVERRLRKQFGWFHQWPGVMPITTASLLFALMHFHTSERAIEPRTLAILLVTKAATDGVFLALAVVVLRGGFRADATDLGVVPAKFGEDLRLGVLTLLAVAAPVYVVSMVAAGMMPKGVAADPIPIFVLSTVLGTLYYRTHRILPGIILHMTFNSTSLLLALLGAG